MLGTSTYPRSVPDSSRVICWALLAVTLLLGSTLAFGTTQDGDKPEVSPVYHLPDNPDELLRINNEMMAFFSARIDRKASFLTKLDAIADAILGEQGLDFRYEVGGVYDVREAFRRRRGNCLTYSMLTVAVAREFGIRAKFNEVLSDPKWNRSGEIVLLCGHINVRVDKWPNSYELDLEMNEDLLASRRSARVVRDARAFAGVYSSAGVYRLAAGDRAEALLLLEKATTIDPSAVSVWTNLGRALANTGELNRAQTSYERALVNDPNELAALSGLAAIHRAKGNSAEAENLEWAETRYRESNPYYWLRAARGEMSEGNLKAARSHLKRAISIKKGEPEIYQLMAEVTLGLGKENEAKRWIKLAQTDES